MRFLLLAVLCLFVTPVKAAVFHVESGGEYQVQGDFGPFGDITGSIFFTFSASINPGVYDPDYGPYYGYLANAFVNNGQLQACLFSQTMSMCGRNLRGTGRFDVSDPDGDGYGSLFVSGFVFPTNMTITDFDISVNLPEGFTVTAIPEPATWLMMLIGFAGLVVIRNYRQPLRRIGRLVQRLEHVPDIAAKRTIPAHQVV